MFIYFHIFTFNDIQIKTLHKAQIHSKIPTHILELEDILTSDVFSFFLYSDRTTFLYEFLIRNKIKITKQDVNTAEFQFWPRFEDNTEADLLIKAGEYYILVEAKFKSDFGKDTGKTKHQLIREIKCGLLDSQSLNKQFVLTWPDQMQFYLPHTSKK